MRIQVLSVLCSLLSFIVAAPARSASVLVELSAPGLAREWPAPHNNIPANATPRFAAFLPAPTGLLSPPSTIEGLSFADSGLADALLTARSMSETTPSPSGLSHDDSSPSAPVPPEISTWAMMMLGLGLVGQAARGRSNRQPPRLLPNQARPV